MVLDDELIRPECLGKYEILVVPGGLSGTDTSPVDVQARQVDGPFMRLISAFATMERHGEKPQRILLSICTGAIFLGTLGIFNDRFCTTHWKAYKGLNTRVQKPTVKMPGSPGTVLPARFVDSGVNEWDVRIISSGGISCGLDASLHVVKIRCGETEAFSTAELLDYAWRKTEGVVFGGDLNTVHSSYGS